MSKPTILVVDDEPQIRKLLQIAIESNDFLYKEATTAKEGLIIAANHPPDLILLDIQLPDKEGISLLKELRVWYHHPIIMLSVLNDEGPIVKALDLGATDYITKPFRTAELMARMRSALRNTADSTSTAEWIFDDLVVNITTRTCKKNGVLVKLTATEFNVLAIMVKNHGCVLTHQFILKEIWGVGFQQETQYLRVFIGTLRKKLEDNPNKPSHIITESGIGYRFL
jgi:two-component system KDP operon response regulator KdpE